MFRQTMGCVLPFDYLAKALIVGLVPLGIVIVIIIVGVFRRLAKKAWLYCALRTNAKLGDFDVVQHQKLRSKLLRLKLWKLSLFSINLLYPYVSYIIIQVYNCVNILDAKVLVADVSVDCSSSRYNAYALYMLFFVLLYPIGIPFVYYLRLRKYHQAGCKHPSYYSSLLL